MKKKAFFIGAALMAFAVFSVAVSYGSRHESKAGDASQEATEGTGKGEMTMERTKRGNTKG